MRYHTKLRAFEPADEVAVFVYQVTARFPKKSCMDGSLRKLHYQLSLSKRLGLLHNEDSSLIEPKIVEIEKVVNGLIRALRDG